MERERNGYNIIIKCNKQTERVRERALALQPVANRGDAKRVDGKYNNKNNNNDDKFISFKELNFIFILFFFDINFDGHICILFARLSFINLISGVPPKQYIIRLWL